MPRLPVLLGAALVALALVAYVVWSPAAPVASPDPAPAEDETPSAANVDPGVHAEMMRLKEAAEAAPDDLDAQLAFARMALGAHRGADAAEALERAVTLAPEDRQPWVDLALAYAAAEAWDASAEASRRMLARFPGDAEAQYNLGAAHANAGRLEEARAAWEAVPQDSETAALASSSLQQLAAMEANPTPAASGATAPPLTADQTALPAGHPPLPAGHPPVGTSKDGVETRVVDGGAADARPVRALVTELAGRD